MNQLVQSKPSIEALRDFLINYRGHSFVGLTTLTNAKAYKRNNPIGTILKLATLTANIGFHYKNSLKSQAKREGKDIDFQVQPRVWGVRMPHTPHVKLVNKETGEEKLYLEYKGEKVHSVQYFTEEGEELAYDDIKHLLPKKSHSSTQAPLEKKIILRDVALGNILRLTIGGKNFLG